jgi:hypothetical protein
LIFLAQGINSKSPEPLDFYVSRLPDPSTKEKVRKKSKKKCLASSKAPIQTPCKSLCQARKEKAVKKNEMYRSQVKPQKKAWYKKDRAGSVLLQTHAGHFGVLLAGLAIAVNGEGDG